MMYGFKTDIVGRTLVGVDVNNQRLIRLRFKGDEPTHYYTEGDCCSTSWVEHLTVPDLWGGAVVTGITEPELPPSVPLIEDDPRYDVLQVYHTAIHTTKGDVIIEYRNDSNGYYGGMLYETDGGEWA